MKKKRNRNRRHRRGNRKIELLIRILVAVLLVLLAILAVFAIKSLKKNKVEEIEIQTEAETETVPEETEPATEPETEEVEEPEVVYPEPEYEFQQEEVEIQIPGLEKEYKLAWVSDVHMVTNKESSDDVMEEFMETVKGRYDSFQTDDGVPSEELWPEIVKFLNYEKFDGVIFGGDMMDYCSASNMDAFMAEYDKLNKKVPLLYIRADHDYGFWYGGEAFTEVDAHNVHTEIDGDKLEDKYLDFGEFVIVGVNGSTKNMTGPQYDIVNGLMEQGKPVIIATHVPYESKADSSLEELSMKERNKIYYWGGGDYVPYEPTTQYFEKIYAEDTNVSQVLAGHLHAEWDGMITEQVPQHIFSPAFKGVIGVIHVVPAEES